MKLDREMLAKLSGMDDDALWGTVVTVAGEKGIRLPASTPPHETMERLRGTLSGSGTLSLGEAVRILSSYRKEHPNG